MRAATSKNECNDFLQRLRSFFMQGDGEPGAKTLWPSLRDIAMFGDGIQAARQG
ncbi:MAG: hypothetical protein LBL48_10420 [Azoarcus sp.]|nr:hypothetical protein [Azoarcus sp.]